MNIRPLWPSLTAWYGLVDRFPVEVAGGWRSDRAVAGRAGSGGSGRVVAVGAGSRADCGVDRGVSTGDRSPRDHTGGAVRLVTAPGEPAPTALGQHPVGDFADQLLVVLFDAARPLRCREVVAVLGEDPSVARHGERVRHRLKKLVTAGRVIEVEPDCSLSRWISPTRRGDLAEAAATSWGPSWMAWVCRRTG
jgi:hypothetical protein